MKELEIQHIDQENQEEKKENKENKENLIEEESLISTEKKEGVESDENDKLLSEVERKEKKELIDVFDNLKKELQEGENAKKSFNDIYKKYLSDIALTQRYIKEGTNIHLIRFVIYFLAPCFGIFFLISIFQLISLKNAVSNLASESMYSYYRCNIRSNCNITYDEQSGNVFDFYNYLYNSTMNEQIDFNLMMITGFVGDMLIKSKGFSKSTIFLFIATLLGLFWLYSLDFEFAEKNVFDYNLMKVIVIAINFLVLLVGAGGSSLLSQKILIEYYLRYKEYRIKSKEEEIKKGNDEREKNNDINKNVQDQDLNGRKSLSNKNYEERQRKREENLEKRKNNKFDYFYMICLTTTIGYFGKYLMNILLDYILKKICRTDDYDKIYFFYCIVGIYALFIILSLFLYKGFRLIFKKNKPKKKDSLKNICKKICDCIKCKKNDEEVKDKDKHNIYRICGYIIYTEKKNIKKKNNIGCCTLCCESTKNYSDEVSHGCCCCCCFCCYEDNICKILCGFCNCIKAIFICLCCCCCDESSCDEFECEDCCCSDYCMCCDCEYNEKDYDKNSQFFCYCYQAQRKSFWCNKFFTNQTQKKIFPFMIEYFILQIMAVGFEKQIEIYQEKQHVHIKTLTSVFLITFFLYFYFSLSFTKFMNSFDEENEENEERKIGEITNELDSLGEKKQDEKENLIEKEKENLIEKEKEDKIEKDINGTDNSTKEQPEEVKNEKPLDKKKSNKKEFISAMSYDMLSGIHGLILFNSIFAVIFSSFYLSDMSEDFKHMIFEEYINIIFFPVLMNKFFYFTLNYYCIYTSEEEKNFDLISSSTLISIYLNVFSFILNRAKVMIPKRIDDDDYDYIKILYIIHIVFASIPALFVGLFLLYFICMSFCSAIECIFEGCNWSVLMIHKFLFCFISFFLCCGGLWIKIDPELKCNITFDCCFDCYCIGSSWYCDGCCCCDSSHSCYSECCDYNINGCDLLCCFACCDCCDTCRY